MKLSIVTCTWNSEPWLAESIASVARQDFPHVEKIFVDGGSTDGTLDRIAAVPGDVKVLHNVRGGISRAMNAGVAVATGDIIAHMHSDDFYLGSDVFCRVAAAFDAQHDAEWLYGRCKTVERGALVENNYEFKSYSWDALIRRNIVPHQSTFMRRSAFNALGGFDETLRYAMDYDLWLKAAKRGAPIQLFDYLAAFRFHGGSLSTTQARQTHAEEWRVRMRHAGSGPSERLEHLARHAVRKIKLSLRSQASGGFRST
jgi:glycosyltransferase involved in cell wall biosynthesis